MSFVDQEEALLKDGGCNKATGANVVLCQKGIDDLAAHYLAKKRFCSKKIKGVEYFFISKSNWCKDSGVELKIY